MCDRFVDPIVTSVDVDVARASLRLLRPAVRTKRKPGGPEAERRDR
jgi:hypothetical protein